MKLYTDRFGQIHVTDGDAPADWRLVATSQPCTKPDDGLTGNARPAPFLIADVATTADRRRVIERTAVEPPVIVGTLLQPA